MRTDIKYIQNSTMSVRSTFPYDIYEHVLVHSEMALDLSLTLLTMIIGVQTSTNKLF